METRFEWDPHKSDSNRKRHGLDFNVASRAFFDPLKQLAIESDEYGEIRWRTTGEIDGLLYVISHTTREEGEQGEIEIIRIISARRATPRESRIFREASEVDR